MRNCPKCLRSNADDASFCSDCGHRFASQSSELPSLHEDLVLPFAVGAQVALGRYVIEAVLGQGGMGTVYRALDVSLDRRCALKVLNSELTAHPTARKRMEREARALARIEHPNVVQVRNIFLEGELLVMELEYMDGGDLRNRVGPDGAAPEQAVAWMQGLLAGVQALHDAQLVHRDIKPENVLLSGQGVPKLTDLGVARDDAESGRTRTRLGAVLGTLEYMSPEQIQGLAVDARSDVYACGMVLYQLVTGALPFSAKSDFEWQEAHVRRPPDMAKLQAKAPHLAAAVGRAIAKDPAERFASAAEMAAGLTAPVVTVPAAAAPLSEWRTAAEDVEVSDASVPLFRLNRMHIARVVLAIIVLVLIGLGGRLWYKRWEARHYGVPLRDTSRSRGESAKVNSISRLIAPTEAAPSGMVFIPPGTFQMGSPPGEGNEDEKLHTVTVSGFWLDETEVTVQAYQGCVKAGKCVGSDMLWWLGSTNSEWSEHCTYGNSPPRTRIRPGYCINGVGFGCAWTV